MLSGGETPAPCWSLSSLPTKPGAAGVVVADCIVVRSGRGKQNHSMANHGRVPRLCVAQPTGVLPPHYPLGARLASASSSVEDEARSGGLTARRRRNDKGRRGGGAFDLSIAEAEVRISTGSQNFRLPHSRSGIWGGFVEASACSRSAHRPSGLAAN